ncbi:transglycosylase domain-containing protein [Deinococcus radiodurans]|uniref:transglycosylase domain-containing protein n=1 Tax=Deinococcus radiodurans TaxID=1299 RepID=UPI000487FDE0|nr:transglycosylase domain-containing protein [Deinococcus radiodurans]ANC72725.1 penicillin-binding protein [Deinococcus radiodurans R1 = ATCC 13939 = DSM 20539]QIP29438.1 penicillin-binding protein [Deinococcus radiodurans]QIP31871.1 penicillin-binding protein [Deinococcus radiodurans]UTA50874.1 transglycosylase domain-containing protein [Deinococcus radiodurans]
MIFFLRFLKFLSSLVIAALVAGVGVAATYVAQWGRELPDYRELDNLTRSLGAETRVYARDNTPLGTLIPRIGDQAVSRTLVQLDEVSPFMVGTLIANEDRRFFEHYGLDPLGLARQVQRLARGEEVQGGSTLTNQLVKNTLLLEEYNQARTPDRKVKEWLLSAQVERSFTKSEILQDYLNAIYWGDGGPVELYGVYSAAQAYFRTAPKDLTLAQAAYLTSLIPNPRNRYENFERQVRPAMKVMLARMVQDGWITQNQADAAWKEKIQPRGWTIVYDDAGNVKSAKLTDPSAKELKAVTTTRAPHFVRQVEDELIRRFGREKVRESGGLRVYTTLDPKVQNAVETASRETYYGYMTAQGQALPPGTTLAAVIIDPYTAEVRGMIGQKLVGSDPPADWNNAAQGQRQVGSTIKPLLYTTALEKGATQLMRQQDTRWCTRDIGSRGGWYCPQDWEGITTNRSMTIREGLDKSLNLVAVRVAEYVGLETFFNKLKLLDIPPNEGTSYAAALGAVETTPVKLAAAYAPFVNGGLYRPPRYITKVTNARGEVLYDADTDVQLPTRVWSPQVAYLGLDMIRGVVNDLGDQQGGLASRAKFGDWPVGGKTGTTNGVTSGNKDFWFVGTTPIYTGAVWVGKQQSGEMSRNYYSGWVNGPIWRRMMELAHKDKTPVKFNEPPGIYRVPVGEATLPGVTVAMMDPRYRRSTTEVVPEAVPEGPKYSETTFDPGTQDANTVVVDIDRATGRIATEFTPPENVVQRRVEIRQLPGYAPAANPAPLTDQQPDPAALKQVKPQAPLPVAPATQKPAQKPAQP